MNNTVKWIMLMLVCTIFAVDCILLLSLNAGAVEVCQKPIVDFTSNEKSGCTMPNFQLTHKLTNYPVSWSKITEIIKPSNPSMVHRHMELKPSVN